jgi:hypothetical protein
MTSWSRRFNTWTERQYTDLAKVPNGYCPNHSTGVTLPADFKVTALQYVD